MGCSSVAKDISIKWLTCGVWLVESYLNSISGTFKCLLTEEVMYISGTKWEIDSALKILNIHPLTYHVFIKSLLYARHWAKHYVYSNGEYRQTYTYLSKECENKKDNVALEKMKVMYRVERNLNYIWSQKRPVRGSAIASHLLRVSQREEGRAFEEEITARHIQGTERSPAVAGTWEQVDRGVRWG